MVANQRTRVRLPMGTTTDDEVTTPEQDAEEDAASPDAPVAGETEDAACDRIVKKYAARAKSPLKAIRAHCISCTGGMVREVGRCSSLICVLHPFRYGRNPFGVHKKK